MTTLDFIANATAILGMAAVATMILWVPPLIEAAVRLARTFYLYVERDGRMVWVVGNKQAAWAAMLEDHGIL